jgi:hypothetical protein
MEPDRIVLEHIRALLLALAVLVDRAAGLPAARRLHLLAVLGRGEAEARCLLVAMASDRCPGDPAATSAPPATTPGDAALLAARFRMLALAVDAMLAQVGAEPPCRRAAPDLPLGCRPRWMAQFTPSLALRATSPPFNGGEVWQCQRRCSSCERGSWPPVAKSAASGIGAPLPRAGGRAGHSHEN